MSEHIHGGGAELRAAVEAADRLLGRIEEVVADHLSRTGDADEKAAFYEIVEILQTSREVATVRLALGDDPHRFGEPTPLAAGDHTG